MEENLTLHPQNRCRKRSIFLSVFERKSLCGLGDHAQRVTNKFLIFLSFILFPFFG